MIEISQAKAAIEKGVKREEFEAVLGHPLDVLEQAQWKDAEAEVAQDALKPKHLAKKLPSLTSRVTKNQLEEEIWKQHGLATGVCNALDCSYQQYKSAIQKWELQDVEAKARKALADLAENAIFRVLSTSQDDKLVMDAAKFVLKTLGKERGWGESATTAVQINAENVDMQQIFGIQKKTKRASDGTMQQ